MNKPIVLQLISPTGYYGAERWVVALARHCDRQKVEIHIAATREAGDPQPEILDRAHELGLSAHEIPLRGRFDPTAMAKTARLARELKASILHGHGYKSDVLSVLARRSTGARVVSTPHGFEKAAGLKLRLYLAAGRWALRQCDAVAPLSAELSEQLRKMGVAASRIYLIENGVDLSEIDEILEQAPSSEAGNPSIEGKDEDRLVYVGRLVPLKNLDKMLRAFDVLCRHHETARLILIGEGPQEGDLRALAESLPAARGRVEFLGYRQNRLEIMRRCSLFTMTSRLEGIPRSMMEAMALGLPAVAYSIPGVDRLLLEGQTGLSVPLDDIEGLASAYRRVLQDRSLRCALGEQARDHIQGNFSARRMAAQYEKLYLDLAAKTI